MLTNTGTVIIGSESVVRLGERAPGDGGDVASRPPDVARLALPPLPTLPR
jgi:hypothetical protein